MFNFFSRFKSDIITDSFRRKTIRDRRLGFESLENRELLSVNMTSAFLPPLHQDHEVVTAAASDVSSDLDNGVLTISGTDQADWVEIEETAASIIVHSSLDGGMTYNTVETYDKSLVNTIDFYGFAGNDTFKNLHEGVSCSVACRLFGGEGNDYLLGGSGNDYLDGGAGDNMLIGGGGANEYYGHGTGSSAFAWTGTGDKWATGSILGDNDAHLIFGVTDRSGNSSDDFDGATLNYVPWTDADINDVLDIASDVYDYTGSYKFFQNTYFDDKAIYFVLTDNYDGLGSVYGYNGYGVDVLFRANAVNSRLTIHEIGHFWNYGEDSSAWVKQYNPFYDEFCAISWDGDTVKADANDNDFAFGVTGDPLEDWAQAISLVFDGFDSYADAPSSKWYQKVEIVNKFATWLGGEDQTEAELAAYERNLVDSQGLANYAVFEEIRGHQRLTSIAAGSVGLTGKLDLSNCTELKTVRCDGNQLTSLDVSGCSALTELNCSGNKLTFSTLPPSDNFTYSYGSQADIDIGTYDADNGRYELAAGSDIDLSGEYSAGGTQTVYTWYYDDRTEVEAGEIVSKGNGIFAAEESLAGRKIHAVLNNTAFPELELKTVSVTVTTDNVPEKIDDVTYVGDLYAGSELVFTVDDQNGDTAVYTVLVDGETATGIEWNGKSFTYTFATPGAHTVEVRIGSGGGMQAFPLNLTIGLAAPANPVAKSDTAQEVDLTWTAVVGATSYEIYRSDSETGQFEKVGTSVSASYTNEGLVAETTYYYKVTAVAGEGGGAVVSADSVVVNVTTTTQGPENVTVGDVTENTIAITWDAVAGATEYVVTYMEGGVSKTEKVTDPAITLTGLISGTVYEIGVQADVEGELTGATKVTATTVSVAGLELTATANDRGADLSWTAVTDAVLYGVWRKNNGTGEVTFVDSTADTGLSDSLIESGNYTYTVYAYDVDGRILDGPAEDTVQAVIVRDGLFIAGVQDGNKVSLSWNTIANASKYSVWRLTGDDWTLLSDSLDGFVHGTSYVDKAAAPDTAHVYVVYAYVGNETEMSNALYFTPVATETPFLSVKQSNTGRNAVLSWNDVDADSYSVWRLPAGGTEDQWTMLGEGMTGTTYTDTAVEVGESYVYIVYADKGGETTELSNYATISIAPIASPHLVAKTEGTNVNLTWTDVGAVTYQIYRQLAYAAADDWNYLDDTTSPSYTDPDLEAGNYVYIVNAIGSDEAEAWTNSVTASIITLDKTPLTAGIAGRTVSLNWTEVGAATYSVWRRPTAAADSAWKLVQSDIAGTSYTDVDVEAGGNYTYFLYGYGTGGNLVTTGVEMISIAVPAAQFRDDVLGTVLNEFDLVEV